MGTMHPANALLVFLIGVVSIFVNYDADAQKIRVRKAKGKCKVWGRAAKFISANYVNGQGKKKTSILLLSGYWGLARHFHYIPELAFALCNMCSNQNGIQPAAIILFCLFDK